MTPVRAQDNIRRQRYHMLTARAGALIYVRPGHRIGVTCGASTMQIPRSHPKAAEAESQEKALESLLELAPKVTTRVKITKAGNSKQEFG